MTSEWYIDIYLKYFSEIAIITWQKYIWGAVLLFIPYFLISGIRFFDIRNWIKWISRNKEYFLISKNRFSDIKKWISRNKELKSKQWRHHKDRHFKIMKIVFHECWLFLNLTLSQIQQRCSRRLWNRQY